MTADTAPVAWSIVVPTFNRPAKLTACLSALKTLRPPRGGFEIIIVNDGGVEPVDVPVSGSHGNAVATTFISQRNSGPAIARNHGAERARGSRLAFTDDDCAPDPGWLIALDESLAASPDALVSGPVLNALHENIFSEASQRLAEYVKAYFDGGGRNERFFTSNNLALARNAFFEAGGFDATFAHSAGEDREFCDRWHVQGRPSILQPLAVVHHSHHLTLTSFLRQHRAYGKGGHSFRAVRGDAGRPVRIDLAFYIGSLHYARQNAGPLRGAALALMTATAHAAYLVGLAEEVAHRRRSSATSEPAASEAGPLHRS